MAHAQPDDSVYLVADYRADLAYYDYIRLHLDDILAMQSHPVITQSAALWGSQRTAEGNALSDYETFLPRASQPRISRLEQIVLTAYLDDPGDVRLAEILALYHWNLSLARKRTSGAALQHTIITSYFLHRILNLGRREHWVAALLDRTEQALARALPSRGRVFSTEMAAHRYFIDAFNHHEANRYRAVDRLLDDVVRNPNNTLTNTFLMTANIWAGGEADFDDPTVLYSFVLCSYFSVRSIELAETMELAWKADPMRQQRFRLAPILGGFSVPARRWLAKFHGDDAAVAVLDAEHREWLAINRAFHSFTVGLMLFEEEENFAEGLASWLTGFDHCGEVPTHSTCGDHPRFSFNRLSFLLGAIDYFLKAGQVETSAIFLPLRGIPDFSFADWDLGRGPWEHRERNAEAISQLYLNGDPSDDPTHFLLKKRKWGPSTITCQTCHQTQSKVWPPEEIDRILLPHESVATIGTWPEFSTTWYGAIEE